MATVSAEAKKKSANVDRNPPNGMTGMGFQTKKHFVEVQKKMFDYVSQQEGYEYDQMRLHAHDHHHHHHRQNHLDRFFPDGKRAPKSHASPSTPVVSHKKVAHLGVPSSQTDRQHRRPSPRPVGAK